jgi:C4-dicarboxylate-specific signal transduction histidine kinase
VEPAVRESAIQVALSDDGPGVSPAVADHLFEPFVSGWEAAGSPGLGLAASRTILERLGGSLAFDPPQQPGARFIMELSVVGRNGDGGSDQTR